MPQLACGEVTATDNHPSGLAGCAPYTDLSRYRNHEYEACTAYVANSATVALQGFYKFGTSRIPYVAAGVRHHFETRYWEGPRRSIEREVDTWPATTALKGNKVRNSITVLSVSANHPQDRALLKTRENWKVTNPEGRVLHREAHQTKNITMCRGRLPGHPLHEWVVVKYARDPGFNCIAFDRQHNLAP